MKKQSEIQQSGDENVKERQGMHEVARPPSPRSKGGEGEGRGGWGEEVGRGDK